MADAPASPHAPVREDWLAQVQEPILEPELPIIDAHHHLWDRPGQRYLLPEYLADTQGGHRLLASVYVQCRSMYSADRAAPFDAVGEVEFAAGIAAQSASGLYGESRLCAAIVAGADLRQGAGIIPVLEEMQARSGGRLRGIRNATAWHPDPRLVSNPRPPPAGILMDERFHAGVACLARHELSLDIWAYHTQLDEVLALARKFPDQLIVLDHCGGPLGAGPYAHQRQAVFQSWSLAIRELASCSNLRLKLGGLGMKVGGFAFDERATPPTSAELAELWRPYVLTCVEAFGAERCLFESNFPVDKGMFAYEVLWNAFKRLTQGWRRTDRDALFSGTAMDTYRLSLTSWPAVVSARS